MGSYIHLKFHIYPLSRFLFLLFIYLNYHSSSHLSFYLFTLTPVEFRSTGPPCVISSLICWCFAYQLAVTSLRWKNKRNVAISMLKKHNSMPSMHINCVSVINKLTHATSRDATNLVNLKWMKVQKIRTQMFNNIFWIILTSEISKHLRNLHANWIQRSFILLFSGENFEDKSCKEEREELGIWRRKRSPKL